MTRNTIDQETSPYLLQHRDNPIHWQPWGEAALVQARRLDRPILLSIGYAACHWCHVMAHESFENPATAGVMNELFVSIKVDLEERPDIDAIYQSALALLGQAGGLATDHVPRAGRAAVPGRPLFSRHRAPRPTGVRSGAAPGPRGLPDRPGRHRSEPRGALGRARPAGGLGQATPPFWMTTPI